MSTPELLGSAITMSAFAMSSPCASVEHCVSASALFRNCFGVRVKLGRLGLSFLAMVRPNSKLYPSVILGRSTTHLRKVVSTFPSLSFASRRMRALEMPMCSTHLNVLGRCPKRSPVCI